MPVRLLTPVRVGWPVLAALLAGVPAAAQEVPDHFAPLAFLVGHCWSGTFAGGREVDTHCYEWMLGRQFIRDRHAVSGGPGYHGESIYHWDPAAKRVVYRYWNTDGGTSQGSLVSEGAVLKADDEHYVGLDGRSLRFRSTITPVGEVRYDVVTEAMSGGRWRTVRRVTYTRSAAPAASEADRRLAVEQLRATHGAWDVTTEFLNADGTVARSVGGSYEFAWVIEDRLLRGESVLPALQMRSALLFYLDEAGGRIEMASVGRDGHLWVMSGPAGGETRTTPDTAMPDGSTTRLRFTRYNVTPDRFESRMETSADGGASWRPGNHQVFVRRPPS